MRFARVVLSIILIVSCMPISAMAEERVVEASAETTNPNITETKDDLEIEVQTEALSSISEPVSMTMEVVDDTPQSTSLTSPIITEIQTAGTDEFIEIYNPNEEPLPLAGLSLWYRGSGASAIQLVDLNGIVLQPKAFAVFGHVAAATGLVTSFAKTSYSLNDTIGEIFISKSAAVDEVLDKVAWGSVSTIDGYIYDTKPAVAPSKGGSLQRCFLDGAVSFSDPRDTSKEFLVYANDLPTPSVGMACVVPDPPRPVNSCEGLSISEIAANVTDQYIELRNSSSREMELEGCQLQTNRSMTKSYIFGEEVLQPGAFRTVYIKDTELTLTKTTSGIVYVLSSDGFTEADTQAYTNLTVDTSWSRDETYGWVQTYALTPDAENIFQKYLPCDEGYERNIDTGRCNKVAIEAMLANCGDGKYRSEETGRCRSIPVASILAACKLGQYRSEETNRCRNIVTASIQKPCKDNQYRSEETNRCRNLPTTTIPDTSFAVQPVKDTGTAFVGWWALGGVSLLAVGYGAWEWRDEIRQLISRITSKSSASR